MSCGLTLFPPLLQRCVKPRLGMCLKLRMSNLDVSLTSVQLVLGMSPHAPKVPSTVRLALKLVSRLGLEPARVCEGSHQPHFFTYAKNCTMCMISGAIKEHATKTVKIVRSRMTSQRLIPEATEPSVTLGNGTATNSLPASTMPARESTQAVDVLPARASRIS